MPYIIGLTGNIACGKSTVRGMIGEHGAATLDADALVHDLYMPGDPVYRAVIEAFGADILGMDAEIDRRALGRKVFGDPVALARLEGLTHPAVIERTWAWVARQTTPGVVVDAVKLIEAGIADGCDAVWVVTCPLEEERRRLMTRPGMTAAEADRRLAAQVPEAAKIARADVVIDNGGTMEATRAQIDRAWAAILQ
ncbi:MAG: dephospho-CoA kinase [Chloroflexota bacterium]|nr:dephospho-CoA kinase [Chloroflexota bacterium]